MISKLHEWHASSMRFLDANPRTNRALTALALFSVNFAFTSAAYSAYVQAAMVNVGQFLAAMTISLAPAVTLSVFKRGGWKFLYRVPVILGIYLVTEKPVLVIMMIICSMWFCWRLVRSENLDWAFPIIRKDSNS